MIFFCVSFLLRIVMASLNLAEIYLIASPTEFISLQFEIVVTILCDQLPFYLFMCQHIHNIEERSSKRGANANTKKYGGPYLLNHKTLGVDDC